MKCVVILFVPKLKNVSDLHNLYICGFDNLVSVNTEQLESCSESLCDVSFL